MKPFTSFLSTSFTLTTLSLALPQSPSSSELNGAATTSHGAVYFMTNSIAGNIVVSHSIGSDGRLTFGGATLTGGLGAHSNPGQPLGSDPLMSQDSLAVSGNNLYVVNAGSNTLSTFSINPSNPTQLTLIGQPVSTGGEFPISVAVSPKNGQVCVLNGGRINSIRCFQPSRSGGGGSLQTIHNSTIFLNSTIGTSITSTPPTGPPQSLADIIFTPDGSHLLVSYKGIPASNTTTAKPGLIASWQMSSSSFGFANTSPSPSISPGGGALPFAMTFLPGTNNKILLNADPSLGYVLYDFSQNGFGKPASQTKPFAIPGSKAVCWSTYSKGTDTFFLADPAAEVVNEVQVQVDSKKNLRGSLLKQYSIGSSVIDMTVVNVGGRDFLYVLTPGKTTISVFDLHSGPGRANLIQPLDFSVLANAFGAPVSEFFVQGMAAWSRSS